MDESRAGVKMNLSFYKTCFKITAVGNIIGAIAAIASVQAHLELFYGAVEINPLLRFYHYNFWIFVLILGVSYWHLGNKPIELRIVALVGAVGKLFVAGSWIHLLSIGFAKPIVLLGILYDGFFGLLMAWFYWKTRNSTTLNEQ